MTKMMMTVLGSAAISLLALTGCNTTEGIGEDLSKAGQAISHAATETSEKMSDSNNKPAEVSTSGKTVHAHDSKSTKSSTVTKKVSDGKKGTASTTTTTTSSTTVDNKK